jgi:hypothetical protein
MYLFSFFHKCGRLWWAGLAAHYALGNWELATPFAARLQEYPGLTRAATYGTLFIESAGLLLLFVPGRARVACVMLELASLVAMHLAIGLTLRVGLFVAVPCVLLLAYLPPTFWDLLARQLAPPAYVIPPLQISKCSEPDARHTAGRT